MIHKSLKWAASAALVAVLAVGAGKAYQARQAKQAQAALAAAALSVPTVFELNAQDVVQARTRTLVQLVPLSGVVRAANTASLKAKVAGELHDLQVREGDPVRVGQVLARIDVTEYQARVQQADQQAQAAAAQVAIAQRQLSNNQALVDQGFISKTALDTSLANLEAAQANHRAALSARDIAGKALADTVVRSPLDGQVGARLAQNGERVGVDARILDLVDLSTLELEAALPPADAALVKVGQLAQLNVEGVPQSVQATVARIGPSAQTASRSVLVYLKLAATPGLRHGLYAQGQVWVKEQTGIALPASSVRNDKPAAYVQRLQTSTTADGTATIVHTPIQVLGQGMDRSAWQTDGANKASGAKSAASNELFIITESIADNSILTSVTTGFIQENTVVRLAKQP
jgi:RND family efflux transporter MFP subunit